MSWLARALRRTLGNADNLFGIREIAGKPRIASDLQFRFEGGGSQARDRVRERRKEQELEQLVAQDRVIGCSGTWRGGFAFGQEHDGLVEKDAH